MKHFDAFKVISELEDIQNDDVKVIAYDDRCSFERN